MTDNLALPKPITAGITTPLAAACTTTPLAAARTTAVQDPVWLLLQDKRSPATRRAYKGDLVDFFGASPTPDVVKAFVGQAVPLLAQRLVLYREEMRAKGLAPATINRRLAAVRSLLKMCYRLGLSSTDGRNLIDGEKTKAYRDTRGTDLDNLKRLLALPDRSTLRGKRDYALLRLLCDNALRRAEVCALTVADFQPDDKRLAILGKGRTEKEFITLHPSSAAAVAAYILASGHKETLASGHKETLASGHGETLEREGPLFLTCDHRPQLAGTGLTSNGLYEVVKTYGTKIGLKLSPHKLRHSAITVALDKTGGDVRRVQKLSRHVKLETLILYDDNRTDQQGEITMLLGDLLE